MGLNKGEKKMKRTELIEAMKIVILGTEKAATLTNYNSIIFDEDWLRSLNDNLSVSYPLKTGLNCAVKADELYKILNKMTKDEVTLSFSDDKLLVSDKKTRLKLLRLPEAEFTKLKSDISSLKIEELDWKPIPKGFSDALPLSLFSTGKDAALGKIAGVAFRGVDVVSTDNFRIAHYQMESSIVDELFRLKTTIIENLVRIGTYEFVAIKDMWLYLKSRSGIIVSGRILPAGEYPLEAILKIFENMEFDETVKGQEFPKELRDSIDRVEVMASESELDFTTQIYIEKVEGGLTIRGEKSFGEVEDFIPWDGELSAPIIASPSFLKKILSITRQVKLSPIRKSILFEAPGFRFLMLAKIG